MKRSDWPTKPGGSNSNIIHTMMHAVQSTWMESEYDESTQGVDLRPEPGNRPDCVLLHLHMPVTKRLLA